MNERRDQLVAAFISMLILAAFVGLGMGWRIAITHAVGFLLAVVFNMRRVPDNNRVLVANIAIIAIALVALVTGWNWISSPTTAGIPVFVFVIYGGVGFVVGTVVTWPPNNKA